MLTEVLNPFKLQNIDFVGRETTKSTSVEFPSTRGEPLTIHTYSGGTFAGTVRMGHS